jgi:hypothetical protein
LISVFDSFSCQFSDAKARVELILLRGELFEKLGEFSKEMEESLQRVVKILSPKVEI